MVRRSLNRRNGGKRRRSMRGGVEATSDDPTPHSENTRRLARQPPIDLSDDDDDDDFTGAKEAKMNSKHTSVTLDGSKSPYRKMWDDWRRRRVANFIKKKEAESRPQPRYLGWMGPLYTNASRIIPNMKRRGGGKSKGRRSKKELRVKPERKPVADAAGGKNRKSTRF